MTNDASTPDSCELKEITNGEFRIETYAGHDGKLLNYGKFINPNRPSTDKALLFIPGLGGTVRNALTYLDALLPYYSCIYAPDLRGFGLNPHEPLNSLKPVIDDFQAFHQILNRSHHQGMDICGISLGGVLATLLVTKFRFYHQGYQRLALLVPAFKASPVKFTPSFTLQTIGKRFLLGKTITTLPYGIESLTQNPKVLQHAECADVPELPVHVDLLLHIRSLGLEALKLTGSLTIPTLIAIADKDVVCDPKTMRKAFKRLPGNIAKKLLEYPNLYHDILLEEEAADIGKSVGQWLNEHSPTHLGAATLNLKPALR